MLRYNNQNTNSVGHQDGNDADALRKRSSPATRSATLLALTLRWMLGAFDEEALALAAVHSFGAHVRNKAVSRWSGHSISQGGKIDTVSISGPSFLHVPSKVAT